MSLRKSIFISLLSANSLTFIGIASSMVIARLLTPSDFGAYAISAIFVGMAHQFRDFGTSTYIVQCEHIDKETIGKAFALTLLAGCLIGIIVIAISQLLANFYRSKDIGYILIILGLNFLIVPFGSITLALLRREMQFKARAIIDHVSAIAGMVTCISFAYFEAGAISLALGTLASTIATGLCASLFRPKNCPWAICFRDLGSVARFGASVTGSALIAQLNRGIIEILGGRIFGLAPVGLFNKAKSVTDQIGALLLGVANQVALPVMSEARRRGQNVSSYYLRSIEFLTIITWPCCMFAAMYSHEILHFMYGKQWDAAAPMLTLMSLLGLFTSPFWLSTQSLLALGKTNVVLAIETFGCTLSVIAIFALSYFELNNLALALVLPSPIGLGYLYYVLRKELRFTHQAFMSTLKKSALATILTATACYTLNIFIQHNNEITRLLSGMTVATASWLVSVYLLRHPIHIEINSAFRVLRDKIVD